MNNTILWALVAQTGVIVAGVIVVLLFNHARFAAMDKRIDDLHSGINARFDDLRSEMNARFDDLRSEMNARFAALHELLRSEIRRLDEKLDRLEHPVLGGPR